MKVLLYAIAAAIFTAAAYVILVGYPHAPTVPPTPIQPQGQVSSVESALSSSTTLAEEAASTSATTTAPAAAKPKAPVKKTASHKAIPVAASSTPQAVRIQDPYATSPLSFGQVNTDARSALVNIMCEQRTGSFQPISGSGIIIDPRGVILTNAHVAQYVLLSETPRVNLSCYVRSGSPAYPKWVASVLYIPAVWVSAHAADVNASHPTGTGEHDYALLSITGTIDGSPLPAPFAYIAPDTRENIAFHGDRELVASYPAEFSGGIAAQYGLFAASSITEVGELLTFATSSVDAISLGGIIEAQSGSSGGAVVNAWDRLVGLVTTVSEGATTGQRDLHAITLGYITRDIAQQTGTDLAGLLTGDLHTKIADFTASTAPALIAQFAPYLH